MITTTVVITCDICETGAAGPLRFTVNGRALALDLCEQHRQQWHASIGPFIAAAAPERRTMHVARELPARPSGAATDLAGLKAWARQHDVALPKRGRIPQATRDAYEAWSTSVAKRGTSA